MRTIFDEVHINHLVAKNRIVRSATWEAIANPDGSPSEEQIQIYRELAEGGVGTIITGFTSVQGSDMYLADGMARLSDDKQIPGWKALTDVCHQHGSRVITQLALGEYVTERGILEADDCTVNDLHNITRLFADAARRAEEAGFDGVQLHAAHNFWVSRFISPYFNHRTDEYGGSQEKRTRLLLEIYEAVRKVVPDLHTTMKMNCSDFRSSGLTPDDAMETCLIMAEAGIDSIEISGNGTSVAGICPGKDEAYFLPFAQELKKRSDVPVILVGGLRSLELMNRIVDEDGIEMLSLSRPLVREPDLIRRWQNGDTAPARCISCNMCYQTPGHRCIFVLRGMK
ncbi:MAG: NADH:flavin oxidoreductase [Anaerovoracaceae bacterium]|jgi:2,4-dienoyl-CoA reductase-like NADH-dependent reductase (Old Yellow Enzyme family)